jgi:hypothetical protein
MTPNSDILPPAGVRLRVTLQQADFLVQIGASRSWLPGLTNHLQ